MKVEVNKNKCLGCGMCVNMCPEVFEFKNGKSSVKKNAPIEKNKDCINQAISLCPAQAIKIEK
ncbi:MAG: ferredoxin [Parcubacteria group bacterium]|nr:ferredoxin [Parcubacteria group bacterium]